MKMKFLILVLIIGMQVSLHANEKGNGGGIQYCPNPVDGQKMYESYDLKEIRDHILENRRRKNVETDEKLTKEDYFNLAVKHVAETEPRLANQIRLAYKFYNAPGRIKDIGKFRLEKTEDFQLFSIDDNCEYRQLVNWIEPEEMERKFGKYELFILRDNLLYNKLDARSQANSDFHEVIYAIARGFGLTNDDSGSNFVRAFSGQAFSPEQHIDLDLFSKISLYGEEIITYPGGDVSTIYHDEIFTLYQHDWWKTAGDYSKVTINNQSEYKLKVVGVMRYYPGTEDSDLPSPTNQEPTYLAPHESITFDLAPSDPGSPYLLQRFLLVTTTTNKPYEYEPPVKVELKFTSNGKTYVRQAKLRSSKNPQIAKMSIRILQPPF